MIYLDTRRRQRDACGRAAVGVDVNSSEDLGAVVRDPRSLLDIFVLVSRSAWSLLQDGNCDLSSLPAGTSVWCSRLSVRDELLIQPTV